MAAVEVSELAKSYPATTAVADVSFTAAAGEITAVLGPNGAGKTTTVEICAGLRRADRGTVRVLGLDPATDRKALTTRVGVMPQGGSGASGVYPTARAGEVLRLYAALYTHPLPDDDVLARLGLASVADTPWRRLSGGEQQRLSLALAIVGRPEVVFLDEPTAGLDVQGRHATWDLVRELRSAGVAVVLTTHAIDEAEQLADAVVIIDAGHVVASGAPAVLTRVPEAGRRLTFHAPPGLPIADLLLALPAGSNVTEPDSGRYVVTADVTPALAAAVTSWCAAQGVLPEGLATGTRSLEDVFLDLTGKAARS